MNLNEKGRFCLSCSKTVVDFSAMSDKQLYDYFNNYTGNTCGRLTDDQLNRNIFAEQQRKPGWFRYALGVLMPALLLTNRAVAQGMIVKKDNVVCAPASTPKKEKLRMGSIAMAEKIDLAPSDPGILQQALTGTAGGISVVYTITEPTVFHKFTKFITDSLRKKTFVVYPNPVVTGATLKTEYKADKGTYYIQVLDMNGVLLQEEKMHASFTLKKNIIPGHYTLLLIDDKRKKIGSQQLIVH
jgi:hypothetical protein